MILFIYRYMNNLFLDKLNIYYFRGSFFIYFWSQKNQDTSSVFSIRLHFGDSRSAIQPFITVTRFHASGTRFYFTLEPMIVSGYT